jgi:hypothetical protein
VGGVAAADNTHLKVAEKNYSQHVVAPIIRVILARRKHVCKWEEKRVLIVAHGFPGKVIHEAWCHCALPGLHLRVASMASQIASTRRHTSYLPREYTLFSPAAEYDRSTQRNPRRMRFCCAHGVDTGRLWAPAGDARSEQGSTDCAEPSTPASGQCKAAEHLLIGGDCHPLEHVANTRLARPHCCVQSCLRGQGVRGDCGRRSSPARVARERTCGRPSESAEDPRDASSPLSARSPGPATAPLCHVRRSSAKILPLCASAWPQLRALGG